jgi:hypothetical protein
MLGKLATDDTFIDDVKTASSRLYYNGEESSDPFLAAAAAMRLSAWWYEIPTRDEKRDLRRVSGEIGGQTHSKGKKVMDFDSIEKFAEETKNYSNQSPEETLLLTLASCILEMLPKARALDEICAQLGALRGANALLTDENQRLRKMINERRWMATEETADY